MRIPSSLILNTYSFPLEQQWERHPRAANPVSQSGHAPLGERVVLDIEQAERLYVFQGSPDHLGRKTQDPQVQRALEAYRDVQLNQEREYIRTLVGLDLYA